MSTFLLTGQDLLSMGYPEGKVIGIALKALEAFPKETKVEELKSVLSNLLTNPSSYIEDPVLAPVAMELLVPVAKEAIIPLKDQGEVYSVFGKENIEAGALNQMDIAMRLPVTVAGALMADAHQGYGLPIGGVLATKNAVIPYGVGVDIGCRMSLTIYDIDEDFFKTNESKFKRELIAHTKFGAGASWTGHLRSDHEVLSKSEFNATPFIKNLYDKAASQLGTSGGGNHFVEFGILEILKEEALLNVPKGKYLALLSHSGSRGFGATIAGYYTKLAKELCKLPREAANLAYLSLDSAEGQEYWLAMNLAGDYASACHEVIHNKISKAIGGTILGRVENHHNFAWKEVLNGEEVIVHRKGATPASENVLGIIPGSMTAPGFLVKGKGEASSINSASHGAGRKMSRTACIKTFTMKDMRAVLKEHGVVLIGGGLDELPMAYKDIESVMKFQSDLVEVLAKFTPKMVRMADDGSRED
ncbi:MAG TPA: RtcB family protein [Cytophagaceae bacterium]